jgi:hypothetical protein
MEGCLTMSLPIHISGKVSLKRDSGNKLTIDSLRDYLSDSILQEEAKSVDTTQEEIHFKVGWFRPLYNWKLLVPITSGQISIHADKNNILVNYKLTFERLLIIATVITAMLSIPALLTKNHFQPAFLLFIWLWLIFGNVLITAYRFPRFIRKCATEVEKQFYITVKSKK